MTPAPADTLQSPADAATLNVLSAGAARAVVRALAAAFEHETGASLAPTFDAAGAIRERLLGGVSCDVVILPAPMLGSLADRGVVERVSIASLGSAATGIAVPAGEAVPSLADLDAFRSALSAASALHCPDLERATAGIHFAVVLRRLGIYARVRERLRAWPDGATAMAELARAEPQGRSGAIGCTQVPEILYTTGIALAGLLPAQFALTTRYAAAVMRSARDPGLARSFVESLTGAGTKAAREARGFA